MVGGFVFGNGYLIIIAVRRKGSFILPEILLSLRKNKHLAKPSNTFDGMRVKWLYYRDFKTRLTIGPGCWLEGGHGSGLSRKPTKSGSLSIVGQRMSRREEKPVSDAPSRPPSRTSRAESMGSLADCSQHGGYWGSNVVPADYQTQNLYIQQV